LELLNFVEKIFGEKSFLKGVLPGYEFRSEQLEMSEFILSSLKKNESGLIEAGTGIGKSLAYLIPALLFATENKKKVAVSTETKSLQKQLFEKDFPTVQKLFKKYFDKEIKYSLCLGSGNYPCRKRFEIALKKGDFTTAELTEVEYISSLFNKKEFFTRLDVSVSAKLWNRVCRESEGCNSFNCPFAPECFYQRARKEWATADVLVMNHYLFFSNIATGKVYLPQTDIVMFDEAHSIYRIASNQLGFTISDVELNGYLESIYQPRKRNSLIKHIVSQEAVDDIKKFIAKIKVEMQIFFEKFRLDLGNELSLRITKKISGKEGTSSVKFLKDLLLILNEVEEDFDEEYIRAEFDIVRGKLLNFVENLSLFVYQNNENYVYWIEQKKSDLINDVFLKGQPIETADIVSKEIISFYDSTFFISATLAIAGDVKYFKNQVGLTKGNTLILPSSFDYKNLVIKYIAKKIVEPSHVNFVREISLASAEIIKLLNGRCLILFTSYRTLSAVKENLISMVDNTLYSQDEFQASDAISRYINDENSVLLGTHSFWQGLDLPGNLLKGVVITRLPFAFPDSPVYQSRIEKIKERGLNPFFDLQVPEAAIRLKQGAGRLVRGKTDKGIIAVLDSRISSKSYGKIFYESLPEGKEVFSLKQLRDAYQNL